MSRKMQTGIARSDTQTVWAIDPAHSTVEFSVKNFFFFIVKGRLTEFAGSSVLDHADIGGSSFEVSIKAASIDTGSKRRDAHLRSADFLEVERYPEIDFQSTRIEPGRDRDTLRLTGSLTLKGQSREIILEVDELDQSRSPEGEEVSYYGTSIELDRFDFGIGHRRGLIGRLLKITINVQAGRQQDLQLKDDSRASKISAMET
jgi:polyisoprenoid-binding protein YceI